MPQTKGKKRRSRKPYGSSVPRSLTVQGEFTTFRHQSRIAMTEQNHPIGTIAVLGFDLAMANSKMWTHYKVIRVGIEVLPLSYCEFLVTPTQRTLMNTRAELLANQQTVKYNNLQNKSKMFWYAPTDAVHRGWQDTTANGNILTGMYAYLSGVNNVTPGPEGILAMEVVDFVLRGFSADA